MADLAITTDLNFLVVVPWVYQMMSLLEWNISSVKKKILKKGKENVHNNKLKVDMKNQSRLVYYYCH